MKRTLKKLHEILAMYHSYKLEDEPACIRLYNDRGVARSIDFDEASHCGMEIEVYFDNSNDLYQWVNSSNLMFAEDCLV